MVQTSRWGFNKFGGSLGGSISDDDGKFSSTDRDLQDRLFAFFENHTHDGGSAPVALATPANAPGSSLSNTGGTIARGGTRYYRYTVVDQFGFESAGSPEVAVVLPDSIHITVAPVVVGGNAGGSALAQGTYYYALTGNTADGETIIGPEAVITIQAGQNQAVLTLPALPSGVTSWNLWRMGVTEDGWTKVGATQPAGTFTDIGYASGACLCDPTTQPPTLDLGPGGTISITITPVSGDLTGAISWRLYETGTSGVYANASLVAAVVPTVVGDPPPASYIDTGTALIIGQPPTTSTTITPSHEVVGGSGGGGADSHWVSDAPTQQPPVTSGDVKPIYVEAGGIDTVGFDIVMVYEPSGFSDGDEFQIDTDGVYTFFGSVQITGATAGDSFVPRLNFDSSLNSLEGFLPTALAPLVIPHGQTDLLSSWSTAPVFLPKGTRVAFQLASYFASAPAEIDASLGCAMVSGSPALAEVYPVPAGVLASATGSSQIDVSWTVDPADTEYHVLCYDQAGGPHPVAKHVVTTGTSSFTGLTLGGNYGIVLLAKKTIDAVDMFSTAAVAVVSLAGDTGFLQDNFNRADGPLALPDWVADSNMVIATNVVQNGAGSGVKYAVHNLGALNKQVTLTHAAPASGAPLVIVLADGASGTSNPRATLTVDPTAVTAPTVDYYDSGGAHTAIPMTAIGGGLTSYAGSSATLVAGICGDQVTLWQGTTLVAAAVMPTSVFATYAGFGLSPHSSNGGTVDDFMVRTYRSPLSTGVSTQGFSASGGTFAPETMPVSDSTVGHIGVFAIYGKHSVATLPGFAQLFEQHDGVGYLSLWSKTLDGSEAGGLQVHAQADAFVGMFRTYSGLTAAAGAGATGNTTPGETVALGDIVISVVGGAPTSAGAPGSDDPNGGDVGDDFSPDNAMIIMSSAEDVGAAGTSETRTMTVGGVSPTYSAATVVLSP